MELSLKSIVNTARAEEKRLSYDSSIVKRKYMIATLDLVNLALMSPQRYVEAFGVAAPGGFAADIGMKRLSVGLSIFGTVVAQRALMSTVPSRLDTDEN
jgi:hypothetical protein